MAFHKPGIASSSTTAKRGGRGVFGLAFTTKDAGARLVLEDKYLTHTVEAPVLNTGWLSPSTFVADYGTWADTGNLFASDNSRATVTVSAGGETAGWLHNFTGLSIPSGAEIIGIQMRFEGYHGGTLEYAYGFVMAQAGTFNDRNATAYSISGIGLSESLVYFGGPSNLGGGCDTNNNNVGDRDWASTDFTDQFAVYLGFGASTGANVFIDTVQLNVFYREVAGSSKTITFTLSEAETLALLTKRARPAAVSIAEVSNYAAFTSRARPVALSIAETINNSFVLSRNRATVWSVVESAAYFFDVSKSSPVIKDLSFAISEASAYIASALRSRGILATLAEVEALAWGAAARARQNITSLTEVGGLTVVGGRTRTNALTIVETENFNIALGRMKGVALALAETANYTFSATKVKLLLASIDELNTFTFGGVRRTREVVEAIDEVLSYTLGNLARGRSITTTIAEVEVLSEAIKRSRALITSLSEIEEITLQPSRRRSVATAIAEVEALTVAMMKVKLIAFVESQTASNAFYVARARSSNITVDSFESVVASFNRARAFVLPVGQTQSFTLDIGRLRTQAINIAQTQGVDVAVGRIREIIQSIANTTDITFNITVVRATGNVINVLVSWTTWNVVSFDEEQATIREVENTETLSLPLLQSATLPVITEYSSTVVVENEPVASLSVIDGRSSVLVIPDNAL